MGLKTTPHKEDRLLVEDSSKVRQAIREVEKISAWVAEIDELVKMTEEYELGNVFDFEVCQKKEEEAWKINDLGVHYQIMWLIGRGVPICRLRDILNDGLQMQEELRDEAERNR